MLRYMEAAQERNLGGGRLYFNAQGIIAAHVVEAAEAPYVAEALRQLVKSGDLTPFRNGYCLTSWMVSGRMGPG